MESRQSSVQRDAGCSRFRFRSPQVRVSYQGAMQYVLTITVNSVLRNATRWYGLINAKAPSSSKTRSRDIRNYVRYGFTVYKLYI